MSPDSSTPPPSRPGHSEPWRVERMVQRVPAHLGEATPPQVSPWIVLAGIALLVLFSCGVVFVLLNVPERLMGLSAIAQPTPTRTARAVTPAPTEAPATLPPPTSTPGPTAVVTKYKVKSGDSLILIASKYKTTVDAIVNANGLKDDTIRIGDELIIPLPTPTLPGGAAPKIPAGSTPTPISRQEPASPPATTPGIVRYTVTKGDTLISIAATYDSTVDGIRMANQLTGDMLSIGQVLSVPVGAWTPPALPNAVAIATVTPTSQFAYASPSLQWPPDGQVLRGTGGATRLEWRAPATLKSNEFYVLHLDYKQDGVKKPLVIQTGQVPQYQLKETDYPGPNSSGTEFSWYVVVVNSGMSAPSPLVRAEARNTQTFAVSPPSETRTFVWY